MHILQRHIVTQYNLTVFHHLFKEELFPKQVRPSGSWSVRSRGYLPSIPTPQQPMGMLAVSVVSDAGLCESETCLKRVDRRQDVSWGTLRHHHHHHNTFPLSLSVAFQNGYWMWSERFRCRCLLLFLITAAMSDGDVN